MSMWREGGRGMGREGTKKRREEGKKQEQVVFEEWAENRLS